MRRSRARSTVKPPKPESKTPTTGPRGEDVRVESFARLAAFINSMVLRWCWWWCRVLGMCGEGQHGQPTFLAPGHPQGIVPARSAEDLHAAFRGLNAL